MTRIIRDGKERIEPEKFIESIEVDYLKHIVRVRERLVTSCIIIVSGSILATYAIVFLVGFGVMTNLPENFLHWLGAATIGTIISNILIVYKSLFPKEDESITEEGGE